MKRYLLTLAIITSTLNCFSQTSTIEDSVLLGPGFANDVYYSLTKTETGNILNKDWDIALQIIPFSLGADIYHPKGCSIIINAVEGVEVYTIPDDSNFTSADTIGFLNGKGAGWKKMYDSDTTWDKGAFNQNASKADAFDFGWGKYGFFVNNHNVVGDSVYLLKTRSGQYKKLVIDSLHFGIWHLKYSNLDNTNLQKLTVVKDSFPNKTFIYISLEDQHIADPEPVIKDWDIVFKKYTPLLTDNSHAPRVGALTNEAGGVKSGQDNVSSFHNANVPAAYSSNISVLGYDWNSWKPGNDSCGITGYPVYFITDVWGNIFKLQFIDCKAETGLIKFIYELVQKSIGIPTFNSIPLNIYPNPTAHHAIINIQSAENSEAVPLKIIDLSGKTVFEKSIALMAGRNAIELETSLKAGLYEVNIQTKEYLLHGKLIIQ